MHLLFQPSFVLGIPYWRLFLARIHWVWKMFARHLQFVPNNTSVPFVCAKHHAVHAPNNGVNRVYVLCSSHFFPLRSLFLQPNLPLYYTPLPGPTRSRLCTFLYHAGIVYSVYISYLVCSYHLPHIEKDLAKLSRSLRKRITKYKLQDVDDSTALLLFSTYRELHKLGVTDCYMFTVSVTASAAISIPSAFNIADR